MAAGRLTCDWRRWRRKDGPRATGDDTDTPAFALACDVALDIDGGARCKVVDVGKVDAAEDDPVTIDPLAERISLGEQDETEVAGGADGPGPAADEADENDLVQLTRLGFHIRWTVFTGVSFHG